MNRGRLFPANEYIVLSTLDLKNIFRSGLSVVASVSQPFFLSTLRSVFRSTGGGVEARWDRFLVVITLRCGSISSVSFSCIFLC